MPENLEYLDLLFDAITLRPIFAYLPVGEGERLGALGALMLTQAVGWQKKAGAGACFQKSLEERQRETAMTMAEMSTARRRLRETPFWEEQEISKPEPRLCVFVNLQVLADVLDDLISGR